MNKILATVALAATCFGVTPAHAADQQWTFMGVGTETCAQFAREYMKNPEQTDLVFFSWAQGYMSAINDFISPKKVLNSMPTFEQRVRVHDYCQQHPSDRYAQAIPPLLDSFPDATNKADKQ
ncbi:MAG: hypothetical protein WCD69_12635 [Xanthobacteraceae bacterium]